VSPDATEAPPQPLGTDPAGSAGPAEPTRPLDGVRLAIAFLTVVPVRLRTAPPLGTAAAWFPAVGAALGAVAGGVAYVARPALGPAVAAVLAVAVLVAATGALHQDGLADCADGLGARGGGVERRLAVMRDSAVGTFGALALGFWLLLIVTALAGLDRDDAFAAMVVAAALGRWAALLHAIGAPPARPEGLGAAFVVSPFAIAVATLLASAAAVGLAGSGGLAALAVGIVVAGVVSAWSRRALGGRTGDTLGTVVALTEAGVIVLLLGLA
jgi:adenosylcobinamide-GDP ribazoletransferase